MSTKDRKKGEKQINNEKKIIRRKHNERGEWIGLAGLRSNPLFCHPTSHTLSRPLPSSHHNKGHHKYKHFRQFKLHTSQFIGPFYSFFYFLWTQASYTHCALLHRGRQGEGSFFFFGCSRGESDRTGSNIYIYHHRHLCLLCHYRLLWRGVFLKVRKEAWERENSPRDG